MTFISLESQRESPGVAHNNCMYCIAMWNPSLTQGMDRTSLRLMSQPQWCHGTLKGDPLIPCPLLSHRAGLSALSAHHSLVVPPDPSKCVKRSYFLGREHPLPSPSKRVEKETNPPMERALASPMRWRNSSPQELGTPEPGIIAKGKKKKRSRPFPAFPRRFR